MAKVEIEELEKFMSGGFNDSQGYKIVEVDETGRAVIEMKIKPQLTNPIHSVHGGAVFGLGDTAGGVAIRATGEYACTTCTTTIDYLSPTVGAESLIAKAQVLKRGRRMSSVEVKIYNEKGTLVASLLGRYANLDENFKAK